jgi:hypothetical protein
VFNDTCSAQLINATPQLGLKKGRYVCIRQKDMRFFVEHLIHACGELHAQSIG